MDGTNKIVYEFQGDVLPLEEAFSKVSKLFKSYLRTAKKTTDGALTEGMTSIETEALNYEKRLRAIVNKSKKKGISKDEQREAHRLYTKLLSLAKRLHTEETKIARVKEKQAQADKKRERQEEQKRKALKEQQAKERASKREAVLSEREYYSSPSSQLKATLRATQLGGLLDNDLISEKASTEIQKAITEWKQLNEQYNKGKVSKKALTDATKNLDNVYKKYISTLIALKQVQQDELAKKDFVKNFTSLESQYKASSQAEQISTLLYSVADIPPSVEGNLSLIVDKWKQISSEFKIGKASAEELANATKFLDDATSKYVPTLKTFLSLEKQSTNAMEEMLGGIISQISNINFWVRTVQQGVEYLGDYVESQNFLDVALAKASESTDDLSLSIQNLNNDIQSMIYGLGVDATQVKTTSAMFVSFSNSMGFTGKTAIEVGNNMTKLAVDMASLNNKDVVTMANALRSALAGQSKAIAVYGYNVLDATMSEYAHQKSLSKEFKALTEAEQSLVRYAYLLENTSSAQGDLSRTIKSPANQMKILTNQIKLLTQNLGALFNIFVYPAVRIINTLLMPINALLTTMTELANANYSEAISSVEDSFDSLTDSANEANEAIGLTSLDEINIGTDTGSLTSGIGEEIQDLIDSISYNNFADEIKPLVSLFKSIGELLAPIWAMISDTTVLEGTIDFINSIARGIQYVTDCVVKLKGIFNDWFNNLPNWLQTVLSGIGKIVSALVGMGSPLATVIVGISAFKTILGSKIFTSFIGNLKTTIVTFGELASAIFKATVSLIEWIVTKTKDIALSIKQALSNNSVAISFGNIAKSTWSAITASVKWIASMVMSIAKAIKLAISNIALSSTFWKVAIASAAAGGLGFVAGMLVATATATSVKSANDKSVTVPALASGGVVTNPAVALIGEGAYNEAVVPLGNSPQFETMKQDIATDVVSAIGKVGRGSNTPIILQVNGKELARALLPDLGITRPQLGVRLV